MADSPACSSEYDSHAWDWTGGRYVCTACGLVDLAGDRIVAAVADRLQVPARALRRSGP